MIPPRLKALTLAKSGVGRKSDPVHGPRNDLFPGSRHSARRGFTAVVVAALLASCSSSRSDGDPSKLPAGSIALLGAGATVA